MNEYPDSDKRPDPEPDSGSPNASAHEGEPDRPVSRNVEDLRNMSRPRSDSGPDPRRVRTWRDALPGGENRGDMDRDPPDGAPPPDDYDMNRPEGEDYGGRWFTGAGRLLVVLALLGLLVPLFTVLFDSRGTVVRTVSSARAQEPAVRIRARVLDVLDGNTIRVQIQGRESIVRYIGVELPSQRDPFHDVIKTVNERWVSGRFVELEADDQDRDPEGRLLRYVWVNNAMVNAALLAAGLGRSVNRSPNERYSRQFTQLEENAQNDGLGLWDTGGRGA